MQYAVRARAVTQNQEYQPQEFQPQSQENRLKSVMSKQDSLDSANGPLNLGSRTSKAGGLNNVGGNNLNLKTDVMRVNVAGQEHILSTALADDFPDTLLGSADKDYYFRKDMNCYYFDRNRHAFDAVMGYYLSGGVFMFPAKLNREVVIREMEFYRIPLYEPQEAPPPEFPEAVTIRQKVYLLQNFPKSSLFATILSGVDCAFIFIAVTMLILETEPRYKQYFEDAAEPSYKYIFGLNSFIMAYFTIDYLFRLCSHPETKVFLKMFLPWLDLLSILPFYLELVMMIPAKKEGAEEGEGSSAFVALRVCRIFRVMRVFKFARRSENLLILIRAVANTYKELILLSGVVSLAVVSFGSIMYTIESLPQSCPEVGECEKTAFVSILTSCWWAVITVTTVGYGDMVPLSSLGKCMGSFAVFCGLIIIALPATIIVTRFSEEYENSKRAAEVNPELNAAM